MSKIFVISDYHFNHNKEFLYSKRGFSNVEEMNKALVSIHNCIVSPEDTVYILGDVCMGSMETLDSSKKLIESLNGHLHIIRGNHDTDMKVQMYLTCKNVVEAEKWAEMLKYKKQSFYLSHFPSVVRNIDDDEPNKKSIINLFGHTHQDTLFYGENANMFHVGADGGAFTPWALDEILEYIDYAKSRKEMGIEISSLKYIDL